MRIRPLLARSGGLRPSTLVALVTLLAVVSCGGGAMAGALGANVVGSKQIKDNAIKSVDVKKDALTGADIDESTLDGSALPAGPPGAQGAKGYTMFMATIAGDCAGDAYGPIAGSSTCTTTEEPARLVMPGPGTFDGIAASTVNPSNSEKPILRVNGVSTAVSCSTSGPSCSNLTSSVHVNAGDQVSLRFECTTTPVCGYALTADRALVSLRFRSD